MLQAVWNHVYGASFRRPVRSRPHHLPNYYTIINNPMDLTTIRKRLKYKYYYSAKDCINDFNTMFSNHYHYNKDECDVYEAMVLQHFFLEELESMPTEEIDVDIETEFLSKKCETLGRLTLESISEDTNDKDAHNISTIEDSSKNVARLSRWTLENFPGEEFKLILPFLSIEDLKNLRLVIKR